MTSAPVAHCINEALPEEVLGVIFEEHAKLEWIAPVIDGRVCHQWRQTILRSPRAWAYLQIRQSCNPAPSQLRQWLDRSGSVPLHIKFMDRIWDDRIWGVEVLDSQCKRINSIVLHGNITLLKDHSFPILQSLTIKADYLDPPLIHWSACCVMPELRSFRARNISVDALPSVIFPVLRVLALHSVNNCDSIIRHSSHSLTSLMLNFISLKYTSESLEFPSLTFLSLYEVKNVKHRIHVPALTTYHESGGIEEESFSTSLPFLIEYGICRLYKESPLNATKLHQCYPNISRLSIRAHPCAVKPFIHSLSRKPTALPMLRILAVAEVYSLMKYSGEDKGSMRKDVFRRNTASSVKMKLYFDGMARIPLYSAYDPDIPY